jgi:zinc/manganese transport system substrate-binding protein
VAAENFYGDLVHEIGGAAVQVTSVLSNPNADPHLFQPGTSTGEAVATADLVIQNGVGYDEWMSRLLAAAPSATRVVVTVADVVHAGGADANPHLWYDAYRMPQVVRAIAAAMERADPTRANVYRAGARRTTAELRPLLAAVHGLRARFAGAPVAYTERVPGLLLADAGLRVLTPPNFARSIEDGTDPAPADVNAMQKLVAGGRVEVLLYNSQAANSVTQSIEQDARAAGIPVVPVTETLPQGETFASWQLGQVEALAAALHKASGR